MPEALKKILHPKRANRRPRSLSMSDYHNHARAVQHYLDGLFAPEDRILANAQKLAQDKGLQPISVTPSIGKTLYLFARLIGAQRILEIGSLGGYSAIWLGRALTDRGRLISLEIDPFHAETAKETIRKAGLETKAAIKTGSALEIMEEMSEQREPPFDLIFLDADKSCYPDYIDPMVRLCRRGGVIMADNLIRRGRVLDPLPQDVQANALAEFNRRIAEDPRLESVILPTLVGYKGGDLDGLSVSRVEI